MLGMLNKCKVLLFFVALTLLFRFSHYSSTEEVLTFEQVICKAIIIRDTIVDVYKEWLGSKTGS